jgi:hypothetical protein
MKQHDLRWNPGLELWFCATCGRMSDHTSREDAETELEVFECELPTISTGDKIDPDMH